MTDYVRTVTRSRMSSVQQPIIPVVGALIRSTPGTISLGQGMVSWGPPPEAIAAARAALDDPATHRYGAVEGTDALLEIIGRKLRSENGLDLTSSRVLVTAGSNMAFQSLVQAITQPGDEIVLSAPYYFNHEMAVRIAGCVPVVVPTDASYQLDADTLARAITPRTRAIVTVSPNNPSGAIYPRAALEAVNALCARQGIYHVSDEAYEYFVYPGAAHYSPGSAPGAGAHSFSLYSLSKAYGFAGWRIGYMVIPEALNEAIYKVQDTVLICPTMVAQAAAAAALEVGRAWCDGFMPALASVRESVLARFREIEAFCDVPAPGGAFYCLPRIRTRMPAMTLMERLVREHRVAAIAGDTFGLGDGTYLRVSYGALDAGTVEEGTKRLVDGLKALRASSPL
jgi:aspartate/methionine/tyrosine aminotransferase